MCLVAVSRQCSKVLLVDEQGRVLLFSGIDRTRPDVPPWWFPVGGALEPNETLVGAAIRPGHGSSSTVNGTRNAWPDAAHFAR